MIQLLISIPFILLAITQMVLTSYRFFSRTAVMPNHIERFKQYFKNDFKHWQPIIISILVVALIIALFVAYAAPFPFALAYYFSAFFSTMLNSSKLGISTIHNIWWFPLMPFFWFKH